MASPAASPAHVTTRPPRAARPARGERRDLLLDAAAEMVARGGVDEVTMESVGSAAGVSRALVYKHFANRRELLSALYDRESARLHAELAAQVAAATGLAEMVRALAEGAIAAQASRGATFAALSASGGRGPAHRDVQRRRDGQTLGYFARQAAEEFGMREADARSGMALALGAIPTLLAQWRRRPTAQHASELADAYVAMTIGGLRELARSSKDT